MRGGARPGAGRPRAATPRGTLSLSVPEDVVRKARELRRQGIKVNDLVAGLVRERYDVLKAGGFA